MSLPPLQNTMGWESKVPLLAPTVLVALICEFQRHQTQEGTVASFLIPPSPGVTQKRLITHSTVLTHTRPYCFPLTQRGGCDNGLEWHLTLLSPVLHLFLQFWNWLSNDFLRVYQLFIFTTSSPPQSSGPGQWEGSGEPGPRPGESWAC